MPLLEIDDLSICFKGINADYEAVKSASFDINEGEILALVGESGSGKSVSALSIMQLLQYPIAYHPSGSIKFNGDELVGADEEKMQKIRGNKISMIFQEPMTSLNPLHTIEKQLSEILIIHKNYKKKNLKKRCIELLKLVGLDQLIDRLHTYPHELSGGQRQRIMIAMALACEPDLLIADEPTTALDVTIQEQILNLIKDLQKKLKMSVLLITHDLTIVKRISNRVCVMHEGRVVEVGKTKDIFSKPKHKYTKYLLSCEPKGSAKKIAKTAATILNVEDLHVKFPIKRNFFGKPVAYIHAVNNISLELKKGETLGIVGESGSGKSTLAAAILRLVKNSSTINFMGCDINKLNNSNMRKLRKDMQMVFQDPYASLNPRMSVSQIIKEGLAAHKIGLSEVVKDKIVKDCLEEVGISSEKSDCYPHEFSGWPKTKNCNSKSYSIKS